MEQFLEFFFILSIFAFGLAGVLIIVYIIALMLLSMWRRFMTVTDSRIDDDEYDPTS